MGGGGGKNAGNRLHGRLQTPQGRKIYSSSFVVLRPRRPMAKNGPPEAQLLVPPPGRMLGFGDDTRTRRDDELRLGEWVCLSQERADHRDFFHEVGVGASGAEISLWALQSYFGPRHVDRHRIRCR